MLLVIANVQSELLSTLQHCQANHPVRLPEREGATVVSGGDWGKPLNGPTLLLSRLPVCTDTPDSVDSHLGGQPRMRPGLLVNQGLHGDLVGQLFGCLGLHELTATCEGGKHRVKFFNLLRRDRQFARNRKDLGHLQRVKLFWCYYGLFGRLRGIEPRRLPRIPPDAQSEIRARDSCWFS